MRWYIRVVLGGLLVAVMLAYAVPAVAHHTSLQMSLITVSGSPPIVLGPSANIEFSPQRGGEISFSFTGAKDAASGRAITALDNTIAIDMVINGNPQTLTPHFDIKDGKARVTLSLGLVATDLVEVKAVRLRTHAGTEFGAMGLRVPGPGMTSALIQVFGTPSDLRLAPTKDADVALQTTNGGTLTVRLDKIKPAPTPGNRVELEIAKNGVVLAPFVFDHVDIDSRGIARLTGALNQSFAKGDVIEIRRIDVFDSDGDRFATLGVRILSP